jgi:type IV pilus assembly protein PilE
MCPDASGDRAVFRQRRAAVTLMETLTALTVISVLLAMSVPSVVRTMEQAHADVAGANLRAIWSAQRFYWLDHRTYAADLVTLEAAGLLDPSIVSGGGRYAYSIASADAAGFSALATRAGSSVWSGQFAIDETGVIAGTVQKPGAGYQITPGYQ